MPDSKEHLAINKPIPDWVTDRIPNIQSKLYLPQKFSDSTHDLWRLKMANDRHDSSIFLKVCNNTNSPFWRIMQQLFGVNLKRDISAFKYLYQTIAELSSLKIPDLIKAETISDPDTKEEGAYILASELSGVAIEEVNIAMVEQLAKHLAGLHQSKNRNWGLINKPVLAQQQWSKRLRQVLTDFSLQQAIPEKHLLNAIESCENVRTAEFVPLMPDLRWDQFLQNDQKLVSLTDLDAFVFAPRELDFVLLEYILTVEQQLQFAKTYSSFDSIPAISKVRPAYRLLLFLMGILGEKDIDIWMGAEGCF